MKAILIVDVDEDMVGEVDYTLLTKENMCNGRAELKPMPHEKEEKDHYDMGWNDCVRVLNNNYNICKLG